MRALSAIGQRSVPPFGRLTVRNGNLKAGGKEYHTIESGETLTSIAKDFGTTVDALVSLNGIENPNLIIAGDSIRVR